MIMMGNKNIDIIQGKAFQPLAIFFSALLVLFGIVLFSTKLDVATFIVLVVLVVVFIYLAFTISGVELNSNLNEYRVYTKSFFRKRGKWKSLIKYQNITLLSSNKSSSMHYGYVTGMSSSEKFKSFDVFLLNDNHYKKILLKSFREKAQAEKLILELKDELNLNYVVYSPKRITRRR